MTVKFSPWGNSQFVDSTGAPASGYKIYTYAAGSSTPQTTYTDSGGLTSQSNPIVLNSLGLPTTGQIWLTSGQSYKLVWTDANDVVKKTEDNISGVNDTTSSQDQWVSSGLTPTYVGATQFSLAGDQTATFQVGRRVKCAVTAGTSYGRITVSAFAAVTTVTVVTDGATPLDSGLSAVSYGLLSATNNSFPALIQNGTGTVVTYDTSGRPLVSLSMSPITASLGADVALNNTANYFDGPSIAQGTSGTWFVSGMVTLKDTASAAAFHCKLWDGTTVIAATMTAYSVSNQEVTASLSGYLASPAGNLRISCKDVSSTSGKIIFNSTGNSKDSTLSAIRIA